MKRYQSILFFLCLAFPFLGNAQINVQAYFQPQTVSAGESATYCIQIENGMGASVKGAPPAVAGLSLQYASDQNLMRNINGQNFSAKNILYSAAATQPGQYIVPEYTIEINGAQYRVNAATLNVAKGVLPVRFFAEMPNRPVYVGETIPFNIKLLFLSQVGLRNISSISKKGDSFTQPQFEQGIQSIETVDNVQYNAITWPASATVLKTGEQTLSFDLQAVVADPSRRSIFDDDDGLFPQFPRGFGMFNQMLDSAISQRQVQIQSQPLTLNVLPLPSQGKPKDFSGAIGQFALSQPVLSQLSAQVGEPLTVKLELSGRGNFERISAPALDLGKDWKTYPPKQDFKPQSARGYEGIISFEYIIIPQSDQPREIPAINFSYFDPEAKAYRTLTSGPVPIAISPAQTPQPAASAPVASTTPAAQRPVDKAPEPAPDKVAQETSASAPFYRSPLFWGVQAVLLVALGYLAYRLHTLKQLSQNPQLARMHLCEKRLKQAMANAAQAAQADDAQNFFPAAQSALRQAAGRMQENPGALAWEDIQRILLERGAGDETVEQARAIWEMGDALKFGGAAKMPLTEAFAKLKTSIQAINGLF